MNRTTFTVVLFLLIGMLVVPAVMAADEKATGVTWTDTKGIFPVSVTEKDIFTGGMIREAFATKKIVEAKDPETVTVRYTNEKADTGIVVTMFCMDSTGRYMPVWGGMANGKDGEWKFALSDDRTLPKNIDKCYFAIIDGNKVAL